MSDIREATNKMVARKTSPWTLFLLGTCVIAALVEVQSQPSSSIPCGSIPQLTGGSYRSDESIYPGDLDSIMRALNSDRPALSLHTLDMEWEKILKDIDRAKPKWYSTKKFNDKDEKRRFQVSLTYLYYYKTQYLIAETKLGEALTEFQNLKLSRGKWKGVPKRDIETLGADLKTRLENACR